MDMNVLNEFIAYLDDLSCQHTTKHYPNIKPSTHTFKMGSKNIKIIIVNSNHCGQSAWGFVEKSTGKIMKAASWNAPDPARHARGNIYDKDSWTVWIGPYGPAYLK